MADGNIHMTVAELNELINNRVAEAIAQYAQTHNTGPHGPAGGLVNPHVCTFKMFLDCKPHNFKGSEGAIGLLRWIEKAESVFEMCNCPDESKVKFATGTLEGPALTWWNSNVQTLGLGEANALTWNGFKTLLQEEYCPRSEMQKLEEEYWHLKMEGSNIEEYTTRSHELSRLLPHMATPASKWIERYIGGLVPQIQGLVTSANPTTIQQAVRLAHQLTDQAVLQGTLPKRTSATKVGDHKRKWEGNNSKSHNQQSYQQNRKQDSNKSYHNSNSGQQSSSSGGYIGKHPKCNRCGFHHDGNQCDRARCQRCGKIGHAAKDCRGELQNNHNN
ncbi:hypothetical protein E3N88_06707 [Mikania micrantha]|uniref:CCHC-type domain-containing protein n=1 Tax=Mikania micrantha TaxID=192012 RepID=A0A5N6PQ77_9ASTR|nr:hypothetical protein E3N88_06707 [Mikania micrantha]